MSWRLRAERAWLRLNGGGRRAAPVLQSEGALGQSSISHPDL